MEFHIVQYKPWSSTLYKPWSSTLYSTNYGAPHCTVQTMGLHIVQYKLWSSTLYSTNHGAPHCAVQTMELHIVQTMELHIVQYKLWSSTLYKPWSSTLYSTNHPHQSCVMYCSALLTAVSLSVFKNPISLPPSLLLPYLLSAVLPAAVVAECSSTSSQNPSPFKHVQWQFFLFISSQCVKIRSIHYYPHVQLLLLSWSFTSTPPNPSCFTPFRIVSSIHDTRVLVGSVCKFDIRIVFVWFVTPCCLVGGYELVSNAGTNIRSGVD
jgi:ABC-type cobalt transport system substrate-binding protein